MIDPHVLSRRSETPAQKRSNDASNIRQGDKAGLCKQGMTRFLEAACALTLSL
jgi:hypothetical protein